MPFYEYFCKPCKSPYKTYHGADEIGGPCPRCNSSEVSKVLPTLSYRSDVKKESTAGQRVEKFIEESRQELQKQLEEARKEL